MKTISRVWDLNHGYCPISRDSEAIKLRHLRRFTCSTSACRQNTVYLHPLTSHKSDAKRVLPIPNGIITRWNPSLVPPKGPWKCLTWSHPLILETRGIRVLKDRRGLNHTGGFWWYLKAGGGGGGGGGRGSSCLPSFRGCPRVPFSGFHLSPYLAGRPLPGQTSSVSSAGGWITFSSVGVRVVLEMKTIILRAFSFGHLIVFSPFIAMEDWYQVLLLVWTVLFIKCYTTADIEVVLDYVLTSLRMFGQSPPESKGILPHKNQTKW